MLQMGDIASRPVINIHSLMIPIYAIVNKYDLDIYSVNSRIWAFFHISILHVISILWPFYYTFYF
jgi:hypothetical protein